MLKQSDLIYIEFITKRPDNIRLIVNEDNKIAQLLNKYLGNIKILICLDFHGVTDLFDDNEKLPSQIPKCVISYIGGNQKHF